MPKLVSIGRGFQSMTRRDLVRNLRNSEVDLEAAASQLGLARQMLWGEERAEADRIMELITGANKRIAALRRSWED